MLNYKRLTAHLGVYLVGFEVKMIPVFTALSAFLLWATGKIKMTKANMFVLSRCSTPVCVSDVSQAVLITQWPQYISSLPDGRAEMHCYQNDTEYDYVYWYKQQKGKSFQFMGYVVADLVNFEGIYKSGFEAATVTKKHSSLTITRVQRRDEAAYLCAASLHNVAAHLTSMTNTHDIETFIELTAG